MQVVVSSISTSFGGELLKNFYIHVEESAHNQKSLSDCIATVMILSFWTDIPLQTMLTQIRLQLEEQSDHGLHRLPFHLHLLDNFCYGKTFFLILG